jgi:hypothetical protein
MDQGLGHRHEGRLGRRPRRVARDSAVRGTVGRNRLPGCRRRPRWPSGHHPAPPSPGPASPLYAAEYPHPGPLPDQPQRRPGPRARAGWPGSAGPAARPAPPIPGRGGGRPVAAPPVGPARPGGTRPGTPARRRTGQRPDQLGAAREPGPGGVGVADRGRVDHGDRVDLQHPGRRSVAAARPGLRRRQRRKVQVTVPSARPAQSSCLNSMGATVRRRRFDGRPGSASGVTKRLK